MNAKSLGVLRALTMVLVLAAFPSYSDEGNHANDGGVGNERPGSPPTKSKEFYDRLSGFAKSDKAIEYSNDVINDKVSLKPEKLKGEFSKWVTAVENMHSKVVSACKDKRGAAQLDELLHDWVSGVANGLSMATLSKQLPGAAAVSGKFNISSLYMTTEAIRKVLELQVPADGDKIADVKKQNEKLLEMLDKTNRLLAGVESQDALKEKFKDLTLEGFGVPVEGAEGVVADNTKRNLKNVIDEAEASIKKDKEVCDFSVKPSSSSSSPTGESEGKKLESRLAELEKKSSLAAAKHKEELEAAETKHKEELAETQKRLKEAARKYTPGPAAGNPDGKDGKGGKDDGKGAPGTGETAPPGGGTPPATGAPTDPQFPPVNPNGFNINGATGDIAALQDQFARELDDIRRQNQLEQQALAQQAALAANQVPSNRTSSVSPAPPPAAAAIPAIPPVSFGGGGQNQQPYPPQMPMQQPYPQPYPPMGMGQPMPTPAPVKVTETETTTSSDPLAMGYPQSMIPPIGQQPMPPPPMIPSTVNGVSVYLTVRYPDGTVQTVPAGTALPAGATVISSSNPYATSATGLVTTPTTTTSGVTTATNVNTITGQISALDTSSRTSSTTTNTSTGSVSSSATGGARAPLTQQ